MHQSTTPSLSQTIWPRWASTQFLTVPIVQSLLPVTFSYSLSSEAVIMRHLRRWKRLWRRSLTHSHQRTSMGLPEVVGTVQVHCSRRRLLWRVLEFRVCTIKKSAHTKKGWKLINIYMYIFLVGLLHRWETVTKTLWLCYPYINIDALSPILKLLSIDIAEYIIYIYIYIYAFFCIYDFGDVYAREFWYVCKYMNIFIWIKKTQVNMYCVYIYIYIYIYIYTKVCTWFYQAYSVNFCVSHAL